MFDQIPKVILRPDIKHLRIRNETADIRSNSIQANAADSFLQQILEFFGRHSLPGPVATIDRSFHEMTQMQRNAFPYVPFQIEPVAAFYIGAPLPEQQGVHLARKQIW